LTSTISTSPAAGSASIPSAAARSAELAATRDHYLALYPQLQALWQARPVDSKLSLHQVA
jgi:hypothetical protein